MCTEERVFLLGLQRMKFTFFSFPTVVTGKNETVIQLAAVTRQCCIKIEEQSSGLDGIHINTVERKKMKGRKSLPECIFV